jgi:hypothetical protein
MNIGALATPQRLHPKPSHPSIIYPRSFPMNYKVASFVRKYDVVIASSTHDKPAFAHRSTPGSGLNVSAAHRAICYVPVTELDAPLLY